MSPSDRPGTALTDPYLTSAFGFAHTLTRSKGKAHGVLYPGSPSSAGGARSRQKIVDVVWPSACYLDGPAGARHFQWSALTAPGGTSPAIMASTCLTVSSDWFSIAGGVRPPIWGVAM